MARLHIVAACTDGKRGEVRTRLRDHATGPDRARRWRESLDAVTAHAVRADELYVGNHWAAVRSMSKVAHARGWTHTHLWVASAGYGLVESSRKLVPYGATFAPGHPDSVVSVAERDAADEQARGWWRDLNKRRKSIASLPSLDPDAAIVFVGSRYYVDAAADDLALVASKLSDPSRLVIVTGAESRHEALHPYLVIPRAGLRSAVGGPLTALHARTALFLLGELFPSTWSAPEARRQVAMLHAVTPVLERPDRQPMSDKEVTAFVRRAFKTDRTLSASRALRLLRQSGKACEQKRFKSLFEEVRRAS